MHHINKLIISLLFIFIFKVETIFCSKEKETILLTSKSFYNQADLIKRYNHLSPSLKADFAEEYKIITKDSYSKILTICLIPIVTSVLSYFIRRLAFNPISEIIFVQIEELLIITSWVSSFVIRFYISPGFIYYIPFIGTLFGIKDLFFLEKLIEEKRITKIEALLKKLEKR